MSNIANSVLLQKPDKSTHNLTEDLKTTTGIGRITPIYLAEVVPGDSVDLTCEFLTKFQPMATPAFQNFNAYVHYFYVPFRVLWKNWKYYIQNVNIPQTTAPPVPPYLQLSTLSPSSFITPATDYIHNYFGFYSPANLEYVNAMPYAMYQLIYNEYYRHEQLTPDLREELYLTDGDNTSKLATLSQMKYRTYKDDYFTAALTSPQSGGEASITLLTNNMMPVYENINPSPGFNELQSTNTGNSRVKQLATADPDISDGYHYVNPSEASFQITMNELIELQRMNEYLVRQNLAGNRYNEYILAFFGVRVPDLRIDRPDYICGVKAPVQLSEVLNTANQQGYQTGQGNAYAEGSNKNYYVQEHGMIMGLYTCMPEKGYTQAIQRLFYKNSYQDYYAPIWDQMGEREIINKELVQDHVDPYGTFGYIPKFAEYRLPFNKVTGEFQDTLTTWHLAMILPTNVVLDNQFISVENPTRTFVITEPDLADPILLWIVNKVYMTRPIKKYSMPVLTNDYGNNIS
nr:MAG: major capsid protein [Microvirus sp.]